MSGLESDDFGLSPRSFFEGLARLQENCPELAAQVKVTFTGQLPELYREQIASHGLQQMVREAGVERVLEIGPGRSADR